MNLKMLCGDLKEYFSPRIIGEVNDDYIKVVKIKGQDVPWHNHQHEDELFLVIEGTLLMETQGQPPQPMEKGDLFVVPKGTMHRVSSNDECLVMLIEPKTTAHTGNVKAAITKSIDQQKY